MVEGLVIEMDGEERCSANTDHVVRKIIIFNTGGANRSQIRPAPKVGLFFLCVCCQRSERKMVLVEKGLIDMLVVSHVCRRTRLVTDKVSDPVHALSLDLSLVHSGDLFRRCAPGR